MSNNDHQSSTKPMKRLKIKVLNNQRVKTLPFAEHVTFIHDLLPATLSKLILESKYREFFDGFAEFFLSKSFDVTITVGVGTTFCFGFMNRLFRLNRCHVAKELYFDESSLSSRIKRSAFRWAIKNINLIITNSQAEIPYLADLLHLSEQQFEFIPWPSQAPLLESPTPSANYIFAGGRSFRDWVTLLKVVESTKIKTIIVANSNDLNCSFPIPPEITAFLDIPYSDYLKLLKSARIVILPLKPTFRSIGQVVLLEAMALGKPCIVADVFGISDYFRSGIDGLSYKPKDVYDLKNKLVQLYNDEIAQERFGHTSLKRIRNEFNVSVYSHAMLKVITRVCDI